MNRKSSSVRLISSIIWLFAIVNDATATLSNLTTCAISGTENPYSSTLGAPHVLSRKKRYLLFPPGAALLATMSFTKALELNSPLGINVVGEVDFFYPMYSSIAELFPKKKNPTSIITPATPIPTPATVIPASDVSGAMMANPKIDAIPGIYNNNGNSWRRKWNKIEYPHPPLQYHPENYIPLKSNYSKWRSSKPNYKSWYKPYSRLVSKPMYIPSEQYTNDIPYSNTNKYRDWNWRQHKSYRSRRDLYDHIKRTAEQHGFEITTCIHRMICEARHYLLPPGISFFQDVLRIVFTIPVSNSIDDGYSKAMEASENECISVYSKKCPYSIIGYLIHTQQEQNKQFQNAK